MGNCARERNTCVISNLTLTELPSVGLIPRSLTPVGAALGRDKLRADSGVARRELSRRLSEEVPLG